MCIAILNKKDSILSDEVLTNSFQNNPDGGGFAYINEHNKLTVIKGIFDLKTFLQTYHDIKQLSKSDVLIHCRIGTSGKRDIKCSHPHYVNKNIVMIHNGILNINVSYNSKSSDTMIFIDTYLKNISPEHLQNKSFIKILADFIGKSNKFIFMDNTGQTAIINKECGHYDTSGNWYSNDSYKYNLSGLTQSTYKLTKKQYRQVKELINNLTINELYELGIHPLLEVNSLTLISDELYQYTGNSFVYLEDLSDSLYDEYIMKYDYLTYDTSYNYYESEVI